MKTNKALTRNPWAWVPSLYYAEGIPYIIVMTVSVIMYKRLGISNSDIALYTSWLYLPWVIKPLWSPIVDIFKTKRFWIVIMQLVVGAGLAGVAFTIPVPQFFRYTLAFFWLLAFSSATHDIAADGFYMLGLTKHQQAFFVGIRSTFYRFAMITGQGLLIILAGYFESTTGLPPIEINVKSAPGFETSAIISTDSINITPQDGDLVILTNSENIFITPLIVNKKKADSLLLFVKTWNLRNGFYKDEREVNESASSMNNKSSWWSEFVVGNLESFIRKYFGPEEIKKSPGGKTGNLGLAYFHLSKIPPGDENIIMNFARESGDESISLVEGTRFTFNQDNWDKPALALFQLDPKLKGESTALFKGRSGNIPLAWTLTFGILTVLFLLFFVYHKFILPYPKTDVSAITEHNKSVFGEFFRTFALFFKKKHILVIISFLLLYRLGESQLVKLASPFLLDNHDLGGIGLTTGEVGLVYGTIGIIALVLGGLLGGYLASKQGLKYWLWWMLIAINLPNTVYIFLSYTLPSSFYIITASVAIEQFGYGFGFTAYMLYMIYISEGDHKTAHFAIATAFMALGMMIPGMVSGWLQELIGYQHFFIWVLIATIPAFIITKFVPLDPEFGKETEKDKINE